MTLRERPLIELLRRPATYGIVKAGTFQRDGVPMVRGGDVQPGRILKDLPRVSPAKSREFSRTVLQQGDVLVALVGYPGNAAVVPAGLAGANISRAVGLLRPGPRLEPEYLVQYLNSPEGRADFLKPSAGSAQIVVNLADLNKLRLPLPSRSEQRAIAGALADMDQLIETLERQVAKRQAIKQGMLQQLLTGRTRLPGFNEEWQQIRLRDVVAKFVVPMRDKPKDLSGPIPWCRIEDFDGRVLHGSRSHQGVTTAVIDHMNLKVFPVGTLVVSCSANLGRCAIVGQALITNQTFIGLEFTQDADVDFYYYMMTAAAGRLNDLASGTTISYLSRGQFEEFEVTVPSIVGEQKAIASALRDVDDNLDSLRSRLAKAQGIRTGVMQQLLTGRVRLPVQAAS